MTSRAEVTTKYAQAYARAAKKARKPRSPKDSYDALKVFQRVWGCFGWAMRQIPRSLDADPADAGILGRNSTHLNWRWHGQHPQ